MHDVIPKDALRALTKRSDGPALTHLGLQLTALLASGITTVLLIRVESPMQWLALFAFSVSILTFFPLLHEAGHQTAFEDRRWNDVCVWLGALVMLQAPSFFREFHWEHHRSTQDPELDPEIAPAPGLLDGWQRNPVTYLMLVSGQGLWVGKLGFTLSCALLPKSIWSKSFPFVRDNRQRRVAIESRIALLVIIAFIWIGWNLVPGFGTLLLGWPLAHVLLGFYLMPEHTGLPQTGDQLKRTRTVKSNPALRWLMWNMPYHSEHHLHPGVPFHALPALHQHLEPSLQNVHSGYIAFHLEAVARALRFR